MCALGHQPLLSYETAKELDLITMTISGVNIQPGDLCPDQIQQQYPSLFTGVGKLQNHQARLHIDKTVAPVAQPHRQIPFHLRKQVEEELKELERQDIMEKVEGPTPWVSPIVALRNPTIHTKSVSVSI